MAILVCNPAVAQCGGTAICGRSNRQTGHPGATACKRQPREWGWQPASCCCGGGPGGGRQRSGGGGRSGCRKADAAGAAGESSPDMEALGISGSGGEQRQQHPHQQQRGRRPRRAGLQREDLPFFIARADLSWKQPWRFEQTSPLTELQLRVQGVGGLDDTAAAAADTPHVSAHFKVQAPQGLGALVVAGEVQAAVPLRCELCGTSFTTDVREPFDALVYFVDSSGGGGGTSAIGEEVTFGLDDQFCDITPLVVDAIVAALPSVSQCGGGSCLQHAGRGVVWVSTPAADPSPASSPFAKLLQAKKQR